MDEPPCLLLTTAGRGIALFVMCNNHAADYSKQSGNPGNRKNFLHLGVLSDIHVWISQLLLVLLHNHKSDCSSNDNKSSLVCVQRKSFSDRKT